MSNLADDAPSPPKGPSTVALIAVVTVLTLIAGGGGWLLGGQLGLTSHGGTAPVDAPAIKSTEEMPSGSVVPLKPILTNVKLPQDVWIRLEAGVVARPGEKISDELAATIGGDFMAFLKTVNLMQLRGPAGLEYLRMDLQERAAMRSEGKIEKVYIWALVME